MDSFELLFESFDIVILFGNFVLEVVILGDEHVQAVFLFILVNFDSHLFLKRFLQFQPQLLLFCDGLIELLFGFGSISLGRVNFFAVFLQLRQLCIEEIVFGVGIFDFGFLLKNMGVQLKQGLDLSD